VPGADDWNSRKAGRRGPTPLEDLAGAVALLDRPRPIADADDG